MKCAWLGLAFLSLFCASGAAVADTTERLSMVANGEIVGSLVATTQGDNVSVDYRVDNNGRGPKHHEDIVLGSGGIPISWTIRGSSTMGGSVDESYHWAKGRAEWRSQADHGDVAAPQPALYVVNDDSPWAAGVYVRAALARPGRTLSALPGGQVSVTQLRETTIGTGQASIDVRIFRLVGVQLDATYVMLDRQGRLFATFDPSGNIGATVRSGYESAAPMLLKLSAELEAEQARDLQQKLAHRFVSPVRIRNVRIFDPARQELSALSTVVVMRDTITEILPGDGDPAPSDETVIEGEGGTLYSGLHDMHSHASLQAGLLYLAAGVTSTRDMGNDNAFLLDLMPRIDSGEIAWPRITPNGFLEGRSPYSARFGLIPETLEDAIKDVHWYADRGYFEIKIYNSFNPDWVKPVAAEAHRLGLGVTGHVPAFDTPDRVIEDGYDTIAHINQLMLGWIIEPNEDTRTPLRLTAMARAADLDLSSDRVQRTVRLMKAHGTALDTTASIVEQLMLSRAGETPPGQEAFLSHMPIGFQRYRKRSFVTIKSPAEDAAYRAGFAKVLETMGMLNRAGVQLLPGTDDTTGFSVQRELELYVLAGLTPAEVLRDATLGCEQYLHRTDRLGTIEKGKLADLVLIAGDPTKDISAIRQPRMVMLRGAVYFPSEIYSALGIAPFAPPPRVTPAPSPTPPSRPGAQVGFGYKLDPDEE